MLALIAHLALITIGIACAYWLGRTDGASAVRRSRRTAGKLLQNHQHIIDGRRLHR